MSWFPGSIYAQVWRCGERAPAGTLARLPEVATTSAERQLPTARRGVWAWSVACLLAACLLVACAPAEPGPRSPAPTRSGSATAGNAHPPASSVAATVAPTVTPTIAATATATASAVRPPGLAARALATMTLEQRVGQVIMVGGAAVRVGAETRSAITRYHVGNLMLTARSFAGVQATARVTSDVRALAGESSTGGVPLLVATDQEGGAVQVLQGNGFSAMPSALEQGSWTPGTLRARARLWGAQLRAAGVDLDLAPVADTVPDASTARTNAPIGRFAREFGYTTDQVGSHALAFVQGMAEAGVATAVKHFPGLGRVRENTDVSADVRDAGTTRHDPYLEPFARAVRGGVPFVMVSTATYSRIDPDVPAAFSPVVITAMLREDLGFDGVVISDDLASATQVARWAPGERAVRFIGAGGDLVLAVDPSVVPQMYRAVLDRARTDVSFRQRVDAAALRVLQAKVRLGLLGRSR